VAISETGDWLLFIALPLYVLQVSGSAVDTSAVFLAELAPAVLVGTVCGSLIDRWNPGRLLTSLTSSQAILLLPLLWLGPDRLWIAFAVAAGQAAITSITTPALHAVVPSLVEPRQLPRANAMAETASNAARLLGSPLGGILLPVLGLDGLVLSDMASFLASAAFLAGCRPAALSSASPRCAKPTSWLTAIGDGARTVRRSPTLISALIISFLSAIAQGLFLVLFVLFVLRSLHAGDQVVGLLRGVQAIGGVLGGLLVGTWAKHLAARTLTVGGLTAFGLLSLLTWNTPAITTETWWYVGLFIAVGLPATAPVTGLLTGTQRASPRRVLGRVLSLIQVAQALGQAAGILLAGLLSSTVSLTVLLNVQAGQLLPRLRSRSGHGASLRSPGAPSPRHRPPHGQPRGRASQMARRTHLPPRTHLALNSASPRAVAQPRFERATSTAQPAASGLHSADQRALAFRLARASVCDASLARTRSRERLAHESCSQATRARWPGAFARARIASRHQDGSSGGAYGTPRSLAAGGVWLPRARAQQGPGRAP
jgi:predicted MFS family arabinose efflux permease